MTDLVDCPDCEGKLKPAREVRLIVLDEYHTPIESSSVPCVVCVDCGTVYYDPEKYVIGYTQTCDMCKYGDQGTGGLYCAIAPPWVDPRIPGEDWTKPNKCVNFKKKA